MGAGAGGLCAEAASGGMTGNEESATWEASISVSRADGHAKVVLNAGVPGVVVGSAQVYPFFVGHGLAPGEKRQRIGANRVAQLPGAGLDDFADFLGDDGGLSRLLERGGK